MTSGEQDYPGEGDDLYPDSPVPPMPDDVKQELAEFITAGKALHLSLVAEATGIEVAHLEAITAKLAGRLRALDPSRDLPVHVGPHLPEEAGTLAMGAVIGPTTLDPAAPETALTAAQNALRSDGWEAVVTEEIDRDPVLSTTWHAAGSPEHGLLRLHLCVATGWALHVAQQRATGGGRPPEPSPDG